jgi:hypothetical protein
MVPESVINVAKKCGTTQLGEKHSWRANETRSQSRCPIIFSFMDGLVGAGAAVCAFCFELQGRR